LRAARVKGLSLGLSKGKHLPLALWVSESRRDRKNKFKALNKKTLAAISADSMFSLRLLASDLLKRQTLSYGKGFVVYGF
jgi:hypothetical protein